MKNSDIVIFAIAFAALSFSLYRKYSKRNQTGHKNEGKSVSSGSVHSVKDDYEPYSGK
ncbi:MAG TPA: hypothetical protein PLX08_12580 [Bacteroidales bacterium]|jgi:hypothetical protein|nr:hypothetical protein [Bacteroidales bacterium]